MKRALILFVPLIVLTGCSIDENAAVAAGNRVSVYVQNDPNDRCKVIISHYKGGNLVPFVATRVDCKS